jgi:superfamily I DNA/RNA helicase
MEAFSRIRKKVALSFAPSHIPQSVQSASAVHHPIPFVIPSSPIIQQLGDGALQAEAKRCLMLLGEKPTEKQWEMILASTTSTRVSAGAGSGKSTTLILRLLIMHKLLGIPLDEMHVFSFTSKSTEEFREKLKNKLIRWEEVIEHKALTDQERKGVEKRVKRVVSTFHSVLYRLRNEVLPDAVPASEIFDTLKEKRASNNGSPALPEEDSKDENPFLSSNISPRQDEVLNAAHARAYRESERYRELMLILRKEQDRLYWLRLAESPMPEDAQKRWYWIRLLQQEKTYHGYTDDWRYVPGSEYLDKQDFPYVDPYQAAVANWLIMKGIKYIHFAPFYIASPIPRAAPGEFRAAFKIGDQLFLHVERYSSLKAKLAYHERDRRRFIAANSSIADQHKVLKVEHFETTNKGELRLTPDAQICLEQWISLSTNASPPSDAPVMLVHLPGTMGDSDIKQLLYQEGVYIESMGLEVEQIQQPVRNSIDLISQSIAEALPLFWKAFREEVALRKYIRYHDILTQLRDEQVIHDLLDQIKHLRHLFIDEFQDVSPELVDWLAKTLHMHVQNGAQVSVIAIGDDYQSIYGWRGSHPTFLIDFQRYFPAQSMGSIELTDNFRSRQPIIDAAEAVLDPVKHKTVKQGKSVFQGREQRFLDPVRLEEAQLSWKLSAAGNDIWSVFCTYVSTLLRDLEVSGYLTELIGKRQDLSVYILARTNSTRRNIPNERTRLRTSLFQALRQQGITRFQIKQITINVGTFHQSKGLEADLVLLLDDPQVPDEHPLRELIFSQASVLGQGAGTYKQTMADETYRLAYVALTRARLAVMWMPLTDRKVEDSSQPETNGTNQANATVSAKGCFVLVKNYLQTHGRLKA